MHFLLQSLPLRAQQTSFVFFKYVINHSRISKGFKFTQDVNSVT